MRGIPIYGVVQCVGEHAKDFPSELRALIEASAYSDLALQQLEAILTTDNTLRALIGTTQAIDLVQGGVKANALPEEAWAAVNHRIATQRSVFCIDEIGSDPRCSFTLPILCLQAVMLSQCNSAIPTS